MKSAAALTLFVSLISTSANSQQVAWIDADPNKPISCLQVCQDNGGETNIAVRGGTYRSANPYFICVADAEGLRPGFDIPGGPYSGRCDVSHDGQGKNLPTVKCLCSDTVISAD